MCEKVHTSSHLSGSMPLRTSSSLRTALRRWAVSSENRVGFPSRTGRWGWRNCGSSGKSKCVGASLRASSLHLLHLLLLCRPLPFSCTLQCPQLLKALFYHSLSYFFTCFFYSKHLKISLCTLSLLTLHWLLNSLV